MPADGEPRLPASYFLLFKDAKNIRRPFLSRSFALLSQVHWMASHCLEDKNNSETNLEILNKAIEVTKKALSEGKSVVPVLAFFDENADLAKQADAAFRDADQELQKCLAELGLSAVGKSMSAALMEDQEGIRQMNELLQAGATSPSSETPVTITVISPDTSVEYTVNKRTPLSAILWREASRNVAFLDRWHFETTGPNERRVNLPLETEVKDLEAQGGERILFLVEGNSPLHTGT